MAEPVINLTGIGEILSLPTGTVRLLVTKADNNGQYSLCEHMLIPGFPGPDPHYHKNYAHTFYVLEGEVLFTFGEDSVTAGAGSSIHIPPSTSHAVANAGTVMARLIEVVAPGGLENYYRELAKHFPPGATISRSVISMIQQNYDTYPA